MKITTTTSSPSQTKWQVRTANTFEALQMVHITFGVAAQNCLGAGICRAMPMKRISAEAAPSSCACKGAVAMVKAEPNNTYAFFFVVASMCKKAVKQYFSDDFFVVEADAEIVLGSTSKRKKTITILAGIYPVKRLDDYLIVRFKT